MKTDQNVSRALQSLWLKEKSEGRCLSICNFFLFFFRKIKIHFHFQNYAAKTVPSLTRKTDPGQKVAQGGISPPMSAKAGAAYGICVEKLGRLGRAFLLHLLKWLASLPGHFARSPRGHDAWIVFSLGGNLEEGRGWL